MMGLVWLDDHFMMVQSQMVTLETARLEIKQILSYWCQNRQRVGVDMVKKSLKVVLNTSESNTTWVKNLLQKAGWHKTELTICLCNIM